MLGFCFVCALGHGIKYLKITTDPVELWAAPNSRSRIEREFFDSNFEPFYRIEQVGWRHTKIYLILSCNLIFFFLFFETGYH